MSFRLPSADGIIFDFNGTLFLDEDENRESWNEISKAIRGKELEDDEFAAFNGRTDYDAVRFLSPGCTREYAEEWSERKEALYKKLCIDRGLELRNGSLDIFRWAKEKGLGIAIASSAPKMNMDWYIPRFHLLDYFPQDAIIAGRTDIPSKPDGTIFRLALNALGIQGEHAIAFEDSKAGVMSALDAAIAHVYRFRNPGAMPLDMPNVMEIGSFSELGEYD